MSHFKKILAIVFSIFLSGCATVLPNQSSKGWSVDNRVSTGVIVGKLSFALLGGSYRVCLKNLNTNKTYEIHERDGAFEWKHSNQGYLEKFFCVELPAGDYLIASVNLADPMYAGGIKTNFTLSVKPNKITYVGTLKYDWQQTTNYFLWKKGKSCFQVVDEYSSAQHEVQSQCPWLSNYEIGEDLIKLK